MEGFILRVINCDNKDEERQRNVLRSIVGVIVSNGEGYYIMNRRISIIH